MQHRDFASNYRENFLEWWSNITLIRWNMTNPFQKNPIIHQETHHCCCERLRTRWWLWGKKVAFGIVLTGMPQKSTPTIGTSAFVSLKLSFCDTHIWQPHFWHLFCVSPTISMSMLKSWLSQERTCGFVCPPKSKHTLCGPAGGGLSGDILDIATTIELSQQLLLF